SLKVTARVVDLPDHERAIVEAHPPVVWERRLSVWRAHVGPNHLGALVGGIRVRAHVELDHALDRFARGVEDLPVRRDLPPMVEAADAPLLVPTKKEGGAPVRAPLLHHAHAPIGIAERDEVLAEEAKANGVTVGLRKFLGEAGGDPVTPHQLAHRRTTTDAAKDFVLLRGKRHMVTPESRLV